MREKQEGKRRRTSTRGPKGKVTKLSIPFLVHGEGGIEHPQWRDEYIISCNA
jgi:hypothetical protein